MLNSLRKCLNSIPKSAKKLVHQLKTLNKFVKRSNQPKRIFSRFDGLKSSFTSMEFPNQLELVFKFIDTNGDGKISPRELREFLLCLGQDKSKVSEEADWMLRHLDSNGDGYVDLNEYMCVAMMGDDDDDDGDHHHTHDSLEDGLWDAFLVFDSDKNGLISARELQQVLKRLGFADCSLKECNLMIKGVDKDGDGFVNFEEFRDMMMGYVRK